MALLVSLFLLGGGRSATSAFEAGRPNVLWQIGKQDQDYAEFAIAGKHAEYPKQFGQRPISFEIGKSDPAKDWPFIQPGPADHWAGAQAHPRSIRFTLPEEPRGTYTLRVDLVDVNQGFTPTLAVRIQDQSGMFLLQTGGGNGSLSNPKLGRAQPVDVQVPPRLLRKGNNEITLTCSEGSWVLYDAVTLTNDPDGHNLEPSMQNLTLAATPLHITVDIATVINTMRGGMGASWHAIEEPIPVGHGGSGWGGYPAASDDAAWQQIDRHARWLGTQHRKASEPNP